MSTSWEDGDEGDCCAFSTDDGFVDFEALMSGDGMRAVLCEDRRVYAVKARLSRKRDCLTKCHGNM